ncbi:peptidylprolyl isomerase [Trichocoleus sp. FACHB-591]|uniref:peptidylprolyl isomerase n=1 Tax=Trichocoleus sp. FACHB-591 TaxID=2692872 RepID=UPI0016880007|nr:peptidylprolyl isomerase [Trichocoleus sp. FACHB-591]MBD2094330.1 peptidylprolyl isomerase [Trichocoleus sp. FACHB-591]
MIQFSGISIELDAITHYLKKGFKLKEVCQNLLYQQLITEAAAARGLVITDTEIQAEAEKQRREKGLEKAADTLVWLADELVTSEDWEVGIRDRLLRQKLSESLFAEQAKKFFAENRLNFEQIAVYQLTVADQKLAQEISYQIQEQEITFYEAAHLYDLNSKRRYQCGYEGHLYRWKIEPDISIAIFGSQPGEVIGPLPTDEGYSLLMVEEFMSPELTPEVYQEILNSLFEEWLANELDYILYHKIN